MRRADGAGRAGGARGQRSRDLGSGKGSERAVPEVEAGTDPAEVLPRDVLAELRETVRPNAFDDAARVLAAAVVALSEEDEEAAVRAARAAKRVAPPPRATR